MIVCLAWGSLVWDPRGLKVEDCWYKDGPSVPVELARQSMDGRLTLVIESNALAMPVLWAKMKSSDIAEARDSLREREGTTENSIGTWQHGDTSRSASPEIAKWAISRGVDGVVWTSLPPRYNGENSIAPSLDQALKYLSELDSDAAVKAEQYIRNAPSQIRTKYRAAFEEQLGWKQNGAT